MKRALLWFDVVATLVLVALAWRYGPRTAWFYGGLALTAVTMPLWILARLQLGRSFTVTAQARQLVTHGHFAVNGVATNIPSYRLKIGDKVEVRQSRRDRELFKTVKETLRSHQAQDWLSLDAANLAGSVIALPRRDQMPLDFNEQLVVEYYSR